ncbi:polysaccharide deacetylase family protein [Candidatus Gracilibacteria bacterium]|nr:polysaccharide deacetylase family protein [Thermales bacterium]NJL96951.1 polysaccharide deacetylase family protein [Candidatus Gracilibacteria bacterium]NJS40984.1 polysaccharide deacetylase family protein [Candidatus Gracilibacteria bacterium]
MLGFLLSLLIANPIIINTNIEPNCKVVKCVALTYDDGPHSTLTPKLLDLVEKKYSSYNIRLTFFVQGHLVMKNKGIVQRIAKGGHELGNHTWAHEYLTQLDSSGIQKTLQKTQQILFSLTGSYPTIFRPPGGHSDQFVRSNTSLREVMWDIDTRDWDHRNRWRTLAIIKNQLKPNSIILLHDIHAESVEASPYIFETLHKSGYKMVTVSHLLKFR